MLNALKSVRRNIIYNNAVATNRIRTFSEEVDNGLRNIIYSVMPAIIYIKYERSTAPPGNCMERAYLLSTAIDDSVVVLENKVKLECTFGLKKIIFVMIRLV